MKISISLENFKILKIFNLWALRDRGLPTRSGSGRLGGGIIRSVVPSPSFETKIRDLGKGILHEAGSLPKIAPTISNFAVLQIGTGQRGHYERGLFTGGISKSLKSREIL